MNEKGAILSSEMRGNVNVQGNTKGCRTEVNLPEIITAKLVSSFANSTFTFSASVCYTQVNTVHSPDAAVFISSLFITDKGQHHCEIKLQPIIIVSVLVPLKTAAQLAFYTLTRADKRGLFSNNRRATCWKMCNKVEKEKEKEDLRKLAGERTVGSDIYMHQPILHNLLTTGTRTTDHRLHC